MADTDFDPYAMLTGDEPTAQEKAKAMAAALRGQQYMGNVLQLSGNPTLASSGQSMLGQAQHQQQALDQMVRERPSYQESLAKLAEAKRMNAMRTDPSSPMNQYTGQIVSQLGGPTLPQGVNAMDIPEQTLGLLERQWAARQRAQALVDAAKARHGSGGGGVGGAGGAPALGSKLGEAVQKDIDALEKSITKDSGRSALAPKVQERLQSSQRIKQAALDENGNIRDLSPSMIAELASNTAAMMSQGAVGEHTLEKFLPKGRSMKTADIEEWLTNGPHGAGQQAYIKAMLDLANREEMLGDRQIKSIQLRHLAAHAQGLGAYPQLYEPVISSNIGDDWKTMVDPKTYSPLPQFRDPLQWGKQAGAAPGRAPTQYLVSPDGKMRIPAGPDGKPIPGAKPEAIPSGEVASRG